MAGEVKPALVRDGDQVAIRDEDGSISMVRHSDLGAAIQEGARPATEVEYNTAKLGASGQVAAGAVGVGQGLSFGYAAPVAVGGLKAVGADATAEDVRRGLKIAQESGKDAYTAGELAGAVAPMLAGAPPAVAGEEIAGNALARAGQRALAAAPRALGEGAAIGVGQQATEDTIENHPYAAEAYLRAGVKGGIIGLLAGTAGAAGAGAAEDASAYIFGRSAQHEAVPLAERFPEVAPAPQRVTIDPNAGLHESTGAIEKPFTFGPKGHAVSLDARALENEFASGVEGGAPIGRYGHADPNAPLRGSPRLEDLFTNEAGLPERQDIFKIGRVKDSELFTDAAHPVYTRQPLADRAGQIPGEGSPLDIRYGINPDAGLELDAFAERRPLTASRSKSAPRSVNLGEVEQEGAIATRPGLSIEERVPDVVPPGPKTFADKIDDLASRQAFKATGAKMGDIRHLGSDAEAQAAEMERIGQRLRTETIDGKPLVSPGASQEEIASRIAQKTNEVAKSIRPMYESLDKAASRPSIDSIASRFDAEIRQPALKTLYGDVELSAADDAIERLAKQLGPRPSHVRLWEARVELDRQLRKTYARIPGQPVPPGEEALKSLKNIVNDELLNAADRASKELGGTIGQKIRLTNELYSDLRTAKTIATKESARGAGSNAISLTDVISGLHGGVGGAVATAANMVRRQYGNQISSHVLGKTAELLRVQKAVADIDGFISKGARSFIEGKGASAAARPPRTVTTEEIRKLRDSVQSADAVRAKIQTGLGDLPQYAPKIAAAVATRAATNAAFLRDNLPKEPAPVGLSWTRTERPISDTERQKAGQMIEVNEDPTIVLDRLLEGRLTRTHVETLKATSPEVYTKTVDYLNQHGTELRAKLSVQQQAAICLLFGYPVNEAFLPANVKAFQSSFSGGSQAPGVGGGGGNAGAPMHLSKDPGQSRMTALNKMEAGDA